MKLQHNLGGLENLGPVNVDTQVFVEPWEKAHFRHPYGDDGREHASGRCNAALSHGRPAHHVQEYVDLGVVAHGR